MVYLLEIRVKARFVFCQERMLLFSHDEEWEKYMSYIYSTVDNRQ